MGCLVPVVGGTWFGGLIGHLILVPLWTLSPLPPLAALLMLLWGGQWAVRGGLLLALQVALLAVRFPYSPGLVRFFYGLTIGRYYRKCEIRGSGLGLMGTSKTLFMFHPHGILSGGFTINGAWGADFNALASERDLDSRSNGTVFLIDNTLRRWVPFFKVLCDLSGRVESATKGTILRFMSEGRNLAIIPGGFEDATLNLRGSHRTMMKGRKGIIKYALQHGYAATPVYTFGESDTYRCFPYFVKQRLALNKLGIPAVLFFGWWACPLLPEQQAQLLTCVGPPLQLPKIQQPSCSDVDEWHAKYITALLDLFEKHKAEAGYPGATLEIW